jgi:hypothetical protein
MATTRLASLKLKRKNQFRIMRARLQSEARAFIGSFQGFIGLTNRSETFTTGPKSNEQHVSGLARQDNRNVIEFLEFDGLGIS